MRPSFLVVGAAKCGTSSLCTLIGRHPDAFMCDPKEPFFFSHNKNYVEKGWDWYESLFADAEGRTAVGEGSVTYSMRAIYPEAGPRIVRDLPDVRIIYIARHPIEQIESMWMMLRSFWEPVWRDGVRADPDFNESVRRATPILLETARYWKQISFYREHFDDERILVLFFEDFTRDPDAVLARCFSHLGIDPAVRVSDSDRPMNVSEHHRYDRRLFKPLRLLPGADRVRAAIPQSVRGALRPLLRRKGSGRPRWEPDALRMAAEVLAPDARAFLTHYGKPEGFWDLEAPAASVS